MITIAGILQFLAQQATQETGPVDEQFIEPIGGGKRFLLLVLAVGLYMLAVWLFRRITRPKKLLLLDAPGRPCNLGAAAVASVVLAKFYLPGGVAALAALAMGEPMGGDLSIQASLIGNVIGDVLVVAVVLAVAHHGFQLGIMRGLGFTGRRWIADSVRGVMGALAVFPVCFGVGWLARAVLVPEAYQSRHVILEFLDAPDAGAGWKLLAVFVALVAAPVVEELVFRGIIQSALAKAFKSKWWAIAVSSIIFAAVHLRFPGEAPYVQGLEQLLPLFVLAVVLGYNYERTGRLWASILIHLLFNGINLAVVLLPN